MRTKLSKRNDISNTMYQKTKSLTVGGIETVPRDQTFHLQGLFSTFFFLRFIQVFNGTLVPQSS